MMQGALFLLIASLAGIHAASLDNANITVTVVEICSFDSCRKGEVCQDLDQGGFVCICDPAAVDAQCSIRLTCTSTWDTVCKSNFGTEACSVWCPPDCLAADGVDIWGTGIYTGDSSICRAAIHDGKMKGANGGAFVLGYLPGQDSYESSLQNGIPSTGYGAWDESFHFVEPGCSDDTCPFGERCKPLSQENTVCLCNSTHAHDACYVPLDCTSDWETACSPLVGKGPCRVWCPSGCLSISAAVWGSGIYTGCMSFALQQIASYTLPRISFS
ncbi:limulus clotting factor C-like [Lingula anatina]|uniref:Limulus clotting factor C-like n=1 Tax=Lingula anatina TaxID=7574 RepID=A0A1S3IQW5_LINAN|nr:limulus clotting factor C-like [Lingula anatina]|eukprot:XP_013400311.1 limulus clotting factor C-like [Lingula anatina]